MFGTGAANRRRGRRARLLRSRAPRRRRARPIETRADVAYAPSVRGGPWPPRGASGALSVYNKKEAPKAFVPNG